MWAHPSVSSIILLYKGKHIGFRLTFQNVFIFLFLDNGAWKVFRQFKDAFT